MQLGAQVVELFGLGPGGWGQRRRTITQPLNLLNPQVSM